MNHNNKKFNILETGCRACHHSKLMLQVSLLTAWAIPTSNAQNMVGVMHFRSRSGRMAIQTSKVHTVFLLLPLMYLSDAYWRRPARKWYPSTNLAVPYAVETTYRMFADINWVPSVMAYLSITCLYWWNVMYLLLLILETERSWVASLQPWNSQCVSVISSPWALCILRVNSVHWGWGGEKTPALEAHWESHQNCLTVSHTLFDGLSDKLSWIWPRAYVNDRRASTVHPDTGSASSSQMSGTSEVEVL